MKVISIMREGLNNDFSVDAPEEMKNFLEGVSSLKSKWSRMKSLMLYEETEAAIDMDCNENESEDDLVAENYIVKQNEILKLHSNFLKQAIVKLENATEELSDEVNKKEVDDYDIVKGDGEVEEISKDDIEDISESILKDIKKCEAIAKTKILNKSIFTNIIESLDDVSSKELEDETDGVSTEMENDEVDLSETYRRLYDVKTSIYMLETSFGTSISRKDLKSLCLENLRNIRKLISSLKEADMSVDALLENAKIAVDNKVNKGYQCRLMRLFNMKSNRLLEHASHIDKLINDISKTSLKYKVR